MRRPELALLLTLATGVACARPPLPENSLGMSFVLVPAGEFLMGSDETPATLARDFPGHEPERFLQLADERPAHRVRITRDFHLGRHEVTVGQFRRFLAASGYVPESVADGTGGYGYDAAHVAGKDAFAGRDPRYSWRNPGFPQDDDHPVVNVSWNDAVALAAWLTRTEGVRYRLPTEAEWEYACRAGTRTRYFHGDDPAGLSAVANTFDATAARYWPRWADRALPDGDAHAFTAPVGSYPPNAFGLHDMLGNVWEWVADWHDDGYYARSPRDDPPGPPDGTVRVRRGGFRNWNTPQTRYTLVGFRLLREIPPQDASAKR
jgi:formylglycine-generating enzyme required for sulfatase activity